MQKSRTSKIRSLTHGRGAVGLTTTICDLYFLYENRSTMRGNTDGEGLDFHGSKIAEHKVRENAEQRKSGEKAAEY